MIGCIAPSGSGSLPLAFATSPVNGGGKHLSRLLEPDTSLYERRARTPERIQGEAHARLL